VYGCWGDEDGVLLPDDALLFSLPPCDGDNGVIFDRMLGVS